MSQVVNSAFPTATSVPMLSNRSTNRNTNTISTSPIPIAPRMSSLNAVAEMSEKWKFTGAHRTSPNANASTLVDTTAEVELPIG